MRKLFRHVHLQWFANDDNPHSFNFVKRLGGGPGVPVFTGTSESNATIALGDAVYASSGLIRVARNTDATILGVAAHAVTGTAATRKSISFYPALPDMVFEGSTDGDATESMPFGTSLGIVGTTGIQEIDSAGGTTSVAHVLGLADGESWDSHANLLFVWEKSQFTGQD